MDNQKQEDAVPRLRVPMILMQSALVPEYVNKPEQVKPSLPVPFCRSTAPSVADKVKDNSTCRLPFQERGTLSSYAASSRTKKDRTDYSAKKRLDQNLHAEHRIFMENLKMERENSFKTKTIAAVKIQRYFRGLAVRMKKEPEKYASLRTSLETHYTKDELSKLVAEAIERADNAS